MDDTQRFPIRFTGAGKAMVALGITQATSDVTLTDDEVRVRLGWSFAATIPRSSVRSVEPDHDPVRGWGAHGWRGVWLVNGSSSGIVRIDLNPPGRARVLVAPVRLHALRVSVQDPDGLIATLSPARSA